MAQKFAELRCEAALNSPATGIIDAPQLMTALLGDFEHAGGTSHFGNKVSQIYEDGCHGVAEFKVGTLIRAGLIVNSGGLGAVGLMHGIKFHGHQDRWAKGNYYSNLGPVLEWVDELDYSVNELSKLIFTQG